MGGFNIYELHQIYIYCVMKHRMSLIEQELLTLPEAASSSQDFHGNRVVQYLEPNRIIKIVHSTLYTLLVDIRIKS